MYCNTLLLSFIPPPCIIVSNREIANINFSFNTSAMSNVVATTYHKGQMISLMSKPQSRSMMWEFTRELDKESLLN